MNNHSEQFGFFAAAAALALIVKRNMDDKEAWWLAGLAVAYSAMRLLHLYFYVTNMSTPRSTVFLFGVICLVAMYCITISAAVAM
jgi:uncharacterized MAPEG superfamily protein